MKCIFIYIAFSFVCITGSAQTAPQGVPATNFVSGKVADSVTQQPIPFATASIVTHQQTAVKNIVSDSLGNFTLTNIPPSSYFLSVSAVGYKAFLSDELTIADISGIDVGLCVLAPETGLLSSVTITGKKPLVATTVDGFSYNAAEDIIPAGATADELLRKVPMLMVDQNGNPMLRGSTNVRVFIDDKPSDVYAPTVADALKQIPAEDIVRVEVILNPSAKYDAEGTDGVINIITRKSRFNAVNGNLRTRIGNIQSNFTPDLNIRQGNWILNANAGVAYYRNRNGSILNREDNSAGIKNSLQQQGEWKNHGKIFYSGLNIIYVFNELQSINAGYRYRTSRDYNDRTTTNNYYQNDSLATSFISNTDNTSGNNVHSVFFGYNGKSRNRKEQYSLLATYFSLRGPDNYDLDQLRNEATDYRELFRGTTTNSELSLQADYTHTINDSLSWDAGFKSQSRRFGSESNFNVYDFPTGSFVNDATRFSQFNYQRDIYAVYSDIAMRFNNWQARAGIRYEQTVLQMEFKDTGVTVPNYNNITPSVVLSKTFGKIHVLKWSYGKRIQRPLSNLNPAISYIDSFNLQSGNLNLQPEIVNRYEMSYTLNGRQLFVIASLFYNSNHNALEGVRLPLGNGIFLNTYQNIGHNDVLGLSFSFTWKWQQKFTINSTITFRENYMESKALQQSVRAFNINGNMTAGYQFNKGYSLQAITYLGLDDYTLQGRRENWQFYGLTLNKKFKGDKVTISFRADNFLSPAHQRLMQTWASPQFKQSITTRYQNAYLFVALSWKLGKKEVKAPTIRQESGE